MTTLNDLLDGSKFTVANEEALSDFARMHLRERGCEPIPRPEVNVRLGSKRDHDVVGQLASTSDLVVVMVANTPEDIDIAIEQSAAYATQAYQVFVLVSARCAGDRITSMPPGPKSDDFLKRFEAKSLGLLLATRARTLKVAADAPVLRPSRPVVAASPPPAFEMPAPSLRFDAPTPSRPRSRRQRFGVLLGAVGLLFILGAMSLSHHHGGIPPTAGGYGPAANLGPSAPMGPCAVTSAEPFHLRPEMTEASIGTEYPPGTSMTVLSSTPLTRRGTRLYRVQTTDGTLGYAFLRPNEGGPNCPPEN